MSFVPFPGKVHFEPVKKESVIASMDEKLVEAGKVIAAGEGCVFLKEGDTFFFLNWGAEQTPKTPDSDEQYWTIAEDSRFIMGKIHA